MKKILFLALFLIACTPDIPEGVTAVSDRSAADGLEGTWNVNGTLDDGGFSWFVEYRFEGDEYWKSGYPPISDHGTYTIEGESLSFAPDGETVYKQAFALAEDGQTIVIGSQTFTFVK